MHVGQWVSKRYEVDGETWTRYGKVIERTSVTVGPKRESVSVFTVQWVDGFVEGGFTMDDEWNSE